LPVREDRHLEEREHLTAFLEAGKTSHDLLIQLDRTFGLRPETIEAAKRSKVNVNFTEFETHVHVSSSLFDTLDEVYHEHFRGDAELCLADCFNLCKGKG